MVGNSVNQCPPKPGNGGGVGDLLLEGSMTKREAAIVSAYTGILLGSFGDMQEYADELLGEPTWTHQFGDADFADRLKELAKPDFIGIKVE